MKLQEVKGPGIGEKAKNTESLRFVQKKAVIIASDPVGNHRHDKIQFRPQEHLHDGEWVGPIFPSKHEKNDSNDDSTVRDKETEKAKIRKAIGQVWCEHSLDGTADAPKVGHFKPGAIAGPHGNNNHEHGPVAELHRQHLGPAVHTHSSNES